MIKENEEIKNMIKDFKTKGSNTTKLEQKIDETYKELEALRLQNQNLNEKVWKTESELNVKVIDLANKISENEKLNLTIDEMREELMGTKDGVENWKEKYQQEKQKNIFLEQQNKILEEANRKLESQLNESQQRNMEADDKILQMSKENSALSTAKQMLQDKIRGMEKEIERMNNMVSMTQSQMGAENRSHFLGSEHNFGINTTFGKDPKRSEAKMIQGLNSQLADLRNEKEEIKGKLAKEKIQMKEQMTNLGEL
jgi:chromosome segregation ATPase